MSEVKRNDLLELALAMMEYIEAIPKGAELPAMPGFDRDWADEVIHKSLLEERKLHSVCYIQKPNNLPNIKE